MAFIGNAIRLSDFDPNHTRYHGKHGGKNDRYLIRSYGESGDDGCDGASGE
jgi:hypothetical protein